MTETMVNGMKFRVWNDTIKRATFAESEDGRVEMIHGCGYITADLTIRKAIAMVYKLPTFRKNAVKTAKVVEETPVAESKEQNKLEVQEVQEAVEQSETETNETTDVSKEVVDNQKEVNSTSFIQQLYDAEYSKTLTVQGGIERFLKLAKEFVKNKSTEMSLIVDTAAQVLHDKYKLDYETIETLEIEAYNS